MIRSYSLEEVAAAHLPADIDGVLWLKRRLVAGEIPGKRISRNIWRMTDADIEAWLMTRDEPAVETELAESDAQVTSIADGLSRRSRSRAQ